VRAQPAKYQIDLFKKAPSLQLPAFSSCEPGLTTYRHIALSS